MATTSTALTTNDPRLTYTLDDMIALGSNIIWNYQSLSFVEKLDGIDYPMQNVISDYLYEIKKACVDVALTDTEYFKYCYRPKILANDLYDNGELYFIILLINGICTCKEFDMKSLKLIKKADMNTILTSIWSSEKYNIQTYNNQ